MITEALWRKAYNFTHRAIGNLMHKEFNSEWMINTRRPASTSIFFAQLHIFWSVFANGWNQNYCFDISFRRVFTNINSTTDLCTLCKRVSRFSLENFSSDSAKKFRRGSLQCFINFGYRKILCLWVEYHDFLLKICRLTVPKNFVGEPLSVSLISGIDKW